MIKTLTWFHKPLQFPLLWSWHNWAYIVALSKIQALPQRSFGCGFLLVKLQHCHNVCRGKVHKKTTFYSKCFKAFLTPKPKSLQQRKGEWERAMSQFCQHDFIWYKRKEATCLVILVFCIDWNFFLSEQCKEKIDQMACAVVVHTVT
jgi:hypothetical protein